MLKCKKFAKALIITSALAASLTSNTFATSKPLIAESFSPRNINFQLTTVNIHRYRISIPNVTDPCYDLSSLDNERMYDAILQIFHEHPDNSFIIKYANMPSTRMTDRELDEYLSESLDQVTEMLIDIASDLHRNSMAIPDAPGYTYITVSDIFASDDSYEYESADEIEIPDL